MFLLSFFLRAVLLGEKKYVMFAATRLSLLKSTNPKLFFGKIIQKIIEDLYLFTERLGICIFCAIYDLSVFKFDCLASVYHMLSQNNYQKFLPTYLP